MMNRDEVTRLLRARSALTSQPYSDDVIDAWAEALDEWDFDQCRAALMRASRATKRVTVADVIECLPRKSSYHETPPAGDWSGPTEGSRRVIAQIRRHMDHRRSGQAHDTTCSICTGQAPAPITDEQLQF